MFAKMLKYTQTHFVSSHFRKPKWYGLKFSWCNDVLQNLKTIQICRQFHHLSIFVVFIIYLNSSIFLAPSLIHYDSFIKNLFKIFLAGNVVTKNRNYLNWREKSALHSLYNKMKRQNDDDFILHHDEKQTVISQD